MENTKMKREIKCCKCGKKIKGGYYNTPSGAFCVECYDKLPKKEKDKNLQKALKARICMSKALLNILKDKIDL